MSFAITKFQEGFEIYDRDHDEGIYVSIDEAEKLWQDLMNKCYEYRMEKLKNDLEL